MVPANKPQFAGVAAVAANLEQTTGCYDIWMFEKDFPQFFSMRMPYDAISCQVEQFICQANAVIQPDRWLEKWRYAAGLYTAHHLTLYLRTFPVHLFTVPADEQEVACLTDPAQVAAAGAAQGIVKSAQLGDSSVTYDTNAATAATERWGDLNSTQYGQLLASMARLVGMGGSCIL